MVPLYHKSMESIETEGFLEEVGGLSPQMQILCYLRLFDTDRLPLAALLADHFQRLALRHFLIGSSKKISNVLGLFSLKDTPGVEDFRRDLELNYFGDTNTFSKEIKDVQTKVTLNECRGQTWRWHSCTLRRPR